ncbi:MFS transporter [Marinobacterium sediminicola]|uniref:Predicted arabinose efflux permease, MFS family n=1 Tax=Marinobacterium sediminicola TaxID=518898 RepID=A0ABY1S163_9GAMM|nr:MFS transporter [Marinobacterium sediminicola]ULG69763.1 MFS transporter [Marinobacterium sediminicola]SMR75427.1 Predicted arabinose efflux permease, MFS family [Marinobacterium sediminicola]
MRLLVISLLALFASLSLLIIGNSFLITLLGLRFSLLGIEPSTIGMVMVCYSAGFVIGSLYADRIVRRVGHIRAFAVFAAVAAMAALIYPMTYNVWYWGILRGVGGLTIAALFITIESWFSAVATNKNRSTIFSLYQIAAYSAAALGQLLIGNGNPINYALFSLAALFIIAGIIPLSLSRMKSPEISEHTDSMSLLQLVQLAPIGVMAAFTSGIFLGSFYALVPLFASLTGLENNEISIYMFASILAAMLFAWPIGWVCDRAKRSNVLLFILVLGAGACAANALVVDMEFGLRLLALCVCMGLASTIYSIGVAITNDMMDSSQIIAASSGLMLSYGVGSVVGPLVSSSLMEYSGPEALFQTLASALVLMAAYTLYRQRRVPPMPVEAQEQFVPAIPDVNALPDIDPRNEEFVDTPIEELFHRTPDTVDSGDEGELMGKADAESAIASPEGNEAAPSADQPEPEEPAPPRSGN